MDQDRRDAQAWAQEWTIKRKKRKAILIATCICASILLSFIVNHISILFTRATFNSEAEMRAALQGRYVADGYDDFEIMGDTVTNTYYERSHYDLEYAKDYGYSEWDDSIYEDNVEKWDYRHGVIKCYWMDDITVSKDGNIHYYERLYKKSSEPKPAPFDKSLLGETTDAKNLDAPNDANNSNVESDPPIGEDGEEETPKQQPDGDQV